MAPVVAEVHLSSAADGDLVATWQSSDDCDSVEISLGPSPLGEDHVPVAVIDSASGSFQLHAASHDLLYVSVRPAEGGRSVIAGQRRVAFDGPRNFRDLGGYRTLDGRRTTWGRVFRSDTLSLSEEDLRLFGKLGIRRVWDFRTDTERASSPNCLPPDLDPAVRLPLIGERPDGLLDLQPIADPDEFLLAAYVGILSKAPESIGALFGGLAQPEGVPAVIHCGGGKDRTGVAAALLLTLLGVGRQDVLDDYELTAQFLDSDQMVEIAKRLDEERRSRPDLPIGVARISKWAMSETLSTIDRSYGGVETYLREVAGVSGDALENIRSRMLT